MAHQQQRDFCLSVKDRFPAFFVGKWVLDIGSLDVNGNNQYLFEDSGYIGVDLLPGRNVDLASMGHELQFPDASFDVIISTECFEHDMHYAKTLRNIYRMLKPGGLFLFSCATTGRPEHGTRRTTPQDAPLTHHLGEWGDYYKNLEEGDVREVLDVDALFSAYEFSTQHQTHDLYFWGFKTGDFEHRTDYSFLMDNSPVQERAQKIVRLTAELEQSHALTQQLRQAAARQDEQLRASQLQCETLAQSLSEETARGEAARRALEEQTARAAALENELAETSTRLRQLTAELRRTQDGLVVSSANRAAAEARVRVLDAEVKQQSLILQKVYGSKSWALTRPLRFLGRLGRGEFALAFDPFTRHPRVRDMLTTARRARNAMGYVARGDFKGLRERVSAHRRDAAIAGHAMLAHGDPAATWGILTPGHTLFVAELIAERLRTHGWQVEIMTVPPAEFSHRLYIVLAPQVFDRLPPGEKRIAYQLEQSVSSRWFTDAYCATLEQSLAVLEYSMVNLAFLATKGVVYPHVNYLPIGATTQFAAHVAAPGKKHDVLFYGDSLSSPRRRRLLEAAQAKFNVHVVNDRFGDAMIQTIKASRVVLNLHYYDDALLEMPRIQECLSLGVPVVSEAAQDQDDYPEVMGGVSFFEQGSIEGMLRALDEALARESVDTSASVRESQARFAFMFDRFLIAMGLLPTSHFRMMHPPLPAEADTFGLSLPETIARRRIFEDVRPADCVIFDGMRRRPGWVGCGMSYAALARHALAHGKTSITVMEDDVLLPEDYEAGLQVIRRHLDSRADWDVFAGVIASLHPETRVLAVQEVDGRTFVTLDKMTSMVFNIYSETALKMFGVWNPEDCDAMANTIDRFLENQVSIRVVTTLPYFVGHREDVYSTLWGFENSRYSELIAESEVLLRQKVEAFLTESGQVSGQA